MCVLKSNHSHRVFAAWHFVDLDHRYCRVNVARAPIEHRMTCLKDGFYLCIVHQPNVSNVISKETGGGKSEISRKVAQFGPNFYPRRINSPITCNIGTPPLTPLALLRCETLDTEARLHRKTSRWPRNHAQ